VVRGRHDHQRGPYGIGQRQHPCGPVAGAQEHHPGAPQRPSHVQRRHRGQLVRQAAEATRRARVAAPPAVPGGRSQRVDVARQQPWRRHGQQHEADESHRRPGHQRVAELAVPCRPPVVDPRQDGGCEDVVQDGIPVAAGQGQPRRRSDRGVRPALDIQVQGTLDVEQVPGVRRRGAQVCVGHQPGGAVGDVEQDDERDLVQCQRPQTSGVRPVLSHAVETAGRGGRGHR